MQRLLLLTVLKFTFVNTQNVWKYDGNKAYWLLRRKLHVFFATLIASTEVIKEIVFIYIESIPFGLISHFTCNGKMQQKRFKAKHLLPFIRMH